MSKPAIWTIILIMSLSLLGVGVIQYMWIQRAVNLDEKNFNDKVRIALSNVKKRLQNDAEIEAEIKYYDQSTAWNKQMDGVDDVTTQRIKDLEYRSNFLDPQMLLEEIDISKLDAYLKKELAVQNIDLNYEYGVYSNRDLAYFIENGNYTATIGDTTKSSNVAAQNPLYKAEYKISLFAEESNEPGHLNLFFPGKTRFLWSSVIPILLISILFTALILICFSYTVYVIFQQKKVSEMKTDFINNMTHEFKTPIATISLASDSILNPGIIENSNKVQRFISIIKQENTRMLSQVEKVLQIAQLDEKDIKLKLSEIDIHEIIENAIINAELKVQSKGGEIIKKLEADPSIIEADSNHISNIVNNLLDNAEKYSPNNPVITVSTKTVSKGIEIMISDNGIGMSKDALKLIFEKFYRVHTGNLHDVKGFGLGLSYVKTMVDAHKGNIRVKSELGKGSSFTVFLPLKQSLK